jgi:hypothetical protein
MRKKASKGVMWHNLMRIISTARVQRSITAPGYNSGAPEGPKTSQGHIDRSEAGVIHEHRYSVRYFVGTTSAGGSIQARRSPEITSPLDGCTRAVGFQYTLSFGLQQHPAFKMSSVEVTPELSVLLVLPRLALLATFSEPQDGYSIGYLTPYSTRHDHATQDGLSFSHLRLRCDYTASKSCFTLARGDPGSS